MRWRLVGGSAYGASKHPLRTTTMTMLCWNPAMARAVSSPPFRKSVVMRADRACPRHPGHRPVLARAVTDTTEPTLSSLLLPAPTVAKFVLVARPAKSFSAGNLQPTPREVKITKSQAPLDATGTALPGTCFFSQKHRRIMDQRMP